MVGDGQVLHAQRAGSFCHFSDGISAVRIAGVTMHETLDVLLVDQLLEFSLRGSQQLVLAIAQFGRYERQAEPSIQLLLAREALRGLTVNRLPPTLEEDAALGGALSQRG